MSQNSWEIYEEQSAPGVETVPATKAAIQAVMNCHYGPTRPDYLEAGAIWCNSTTNVWYKYNGTSDTPINVGSVTTELPADDTTPSVSGGGTFEEVFTTPTTVTALDDGVKGDEVTIMFTTSNMTVDGSLTKTGMTIPCISGDVMKWTHNGTTFKQTGGNVGMGQFVKITSNSIGSWPAGSVTSYASGEVDVSGDGIRKGANVAVIVVQMDNGTSTDMLLWVAEDTSGTGSDVVIRTRQTQGIIAQMFAKLDNNGKFAVKHQTAITTSSASAIGYYI